MEAGPLHVNTWGDGLFLVFDTVMAAAGAAVALQAAFRAVDLRAAGLPEGLALRVGGHYGPVHAIRDPFLGRPGFLGREVTVAARIEPVTAPGSIFVSEPFAAALAIAGGGRFRCEPVTPEGGDGHAGPHPLFSLRETGGGLTAA